MKEAHINETLEALKYELKTLKDEIKELTSDKKALKDKVKALTDNKNALKKDLAERSNFYCWHCGFELRDVCPRCGYGMVDTAYRDAESMDSSDEDIDDANG